MRNHCSFVFRLAICLLGFVFLHSSFLFGQKGAGKGGGAAGASTAAAGPAAGAASGGASSAAASPGAATTSGSSSNYLLIFDGKTGNFQGIPFDVPVTLEFYFNQKVNVRAIGYFETSNKYFRKLVRGKYDSVSDYIAEAVQHSIGTNKVHRVPLTSVDTFQTNTTDPTEPPYYIKLSTPVFLNPNQHYIFGYATSVTGSDYFLQLNKVFVKFIRAHNIRDSLKGQSGPDDAELKLTNDLGYKAPSAGDSAARANFAKYDAFRGNLKEERKLKKIDPQGWESYKSFIDSQYQRYRPAKTDDNGEKPDLTKERYEAYVRFVQDWIDIYESGYSDTSSKAGGAFRDAARDYRSVYYDMGRTYTLSTLPDFLYDIRQEMPFLGKRRVDSPAAIISTTFDFYKVYAMILRIAPVYNQLTAVALDADQVEKKLYDLGGDDCLRKILPILETNNACLNTLSKYCPLLQDSTALLALLRGLIQRDDTLDLYFRSFKSMPGRLRSPDFPSQDNSGMVDTLTTTRALLDSLRRLLQANPRIVPVDCDDLNKKIVGTITQLDSTAARINRFKGNYLRSIDTTRSFAAAKLFSGDSYTFSLSTRQGFELSADIGVVDYGINSPPFTKVYGNNWGRVTPYFGVHWNFRYVNTDIPFSQRPYRLLAHMSFFLGATILSAQEAGKFNNLFSGSSLLAGIGYKLNNDGLRLVTGTMIVKRLNSDPLVSSTTVGFLPFFGVSYDFNSLYSNMVGLIK